VLNKVVNGFKKVMGLKESTFVVIEENNIVKYFDTLNMKNN
jgi:hypothetical protein